MDWGLLAGLTPEDRQALLARMRRRRFVKGEVIFHEGDPADTLHLIDKGRVAVRATTPLGDTAMLRVIGPGSWFGELAVVSEAPRSATVAALEPTETLSLQRDQVEELRRSNTQVNEVLITALVEEVRRLAAQLVQALYVPADKRVLRRLAELADLYGEDGVPTMIPLTQDDLAEMAGTTRPTANKILRAAADDGLIALHRGRIEILDQPSLVRHSR
jgi:CRP/FNR family cyclic AMP-dependent transcriptional regulator